MSFLYPFKTVLVGKTAARWGTCSFETLSSSCQFYHKSQHSPGSQSSWNTECHGFISHHHCESWIPQRRNHHKETHFQSDRDPGLRSTIWISKRHWKPSSPCGSPPRPGLVVLNLLPLLQTGIGSGKLLRDGTGHYYSLYFILQINIFTDLSTVQKHLGLCRLSRVHVECKQACCYIKMKFGVKLAEECSFYTEMMEFGIFLFFQCRLQLDSSWDS